MKYILLVRQDCDFCDSAIRLLEEKDLDYVVVDAGRDLLTAHEIKKAFDWHTFPIVLEKKSNSLTLVGGYTDMESYLTDEK
tara:strand:- start:2021 stop:2263 length:243 start_codon:yes stop_codon:yes gene_type:complete